MKSHESIAPLEDEDIEFPVPNVNLPGPVNWFCILSHFGHDFIVVLKKLETVTE
jgi:hypothetical protein